MTVIHARISEHQSNMESDQRVVSVYTGQDRDHMSFAGSLVLSLRDAEVVVAVLDGQDTHIVEFQRNGWMVRHPLACRTDLFNCDANAHDIYADDGQYVLERDNAGYWVLGEKTA